MDISDADLNLLPVFDALLRAQSVTGAGRALGMSQPAMSYALARLRAQFGDPLFVRSGRAMLPTPRARALAAPVAEVLDLTRRRILADSGFDAARAAREFSICLTDVGALGFLPRLLAAVRLEAPGCTLRSQQWPVSELERALESGAADLAIGYFPDLPGGLYQQRLYERSYVCSFRVDHPSIGQRLSLRQYAGLDHAVVRTAARIQESVDRALKRAGLSRRVVLATAHYTSLPPLLAASDLVATLPEEVARIFATYVPIRSLPSPVRLPNVVLRQYWHPLYHQDAANRWLRSLVARLFAERQSRAAG